MGAEFSSFVIGPIVGGVAVALAISAIVSAQKEQPDDTQRSTAYAIGAIVALVILIIFGILVTLVQKKKK